MMTTALVSEHSHSPERAHSLASPPPGSPAAVGALKSRLNEGADDCPAVVAKLCARWRVIIAASGAPQWILQHRGAGPKAWRGDFFCQTRRMLLLAIRERAGAVDPEALAIIMALPAHIRDARS